MTTLRVGTRGSALAQWQTRHVATRLAEVLPDITIELVEIVSTGDQLTDVRLADVEGTGFFTAELEHALLDGRVDFAVHSCKDLPVVETPGLVVPALLARGPVEDVLVARDGLTLSTLPEGSRVGTCSVRRSAQLRARRPDLQLEPLRGNVPTRVAKVEGGHLDAIVLARAGLVRLGLAGCITEVFPADAVLPAPAQGAMAVQCRSSDAALVRHLATLDDAATRATVTAERVMLHALGGGCSVPVGAVATISAGQISLTGAVFDIADGRAVRASAAGTSAKHVGLTVADELIGLGAGELLDRCRQATATEVRA